VGGFEALTDLIICAMDHVAVLRLQTQDKA
jgi:hypothetical protein